MPAIARNERREWLYPARIVVAILVGGVLIAGALWFRPQNASANDERMELLAQDLSRLSAKLHAIENSLQFLVDQGRLPQTTVPSHTVPVESMIPGSIQEDIGAIRADVLRLLETVDAEHGAPPAEGSRRSDLRRFAESGTPPPASSWRFLTPQQILHEYGVPNAVSEAGSGVRFMYSWPEPDNSYVTFVIKEGMAVNVEMGRTR